MVTQTRKHHRYAHLFDVKWKNANNRKLSANYYLDRPPNAPKKY
jgi:hypothetical protein